MNDAEPVGENTEDIQKLRCQFRLEEPATDLSLCNLLSPKKNKTRLKYLKSGDSLCYRPNHPIDGGDILVGGECAHLTATNEGRRIQNQKRQKTKNLLLHHHEPRSLELEIGQRIFIVQITRSRERADG
jgi:hypothetical protein